MIDVASPEDAVETKMPKTDAELSKLLGKLRQETKGLGFEEDLAVHERYIASAKNTDHLSAFENSKANLMWYSGFKQEAVEFLMDRSTQYPDSDELAYSAGENLVRLGRFKEAIFYLSRCIDISIRTSDTWYIHSAVLLRSYSEAMTGDFDLATRDLDAVPDDEGDMRWLWLQPPVSKESVLAMIKSGKSDL